MKKNIVLVLSLLFVVILQACTPTKATIYLGITHDPEFINSDILVDEKSSATLEDGVLGDSLVIMPGFHTITFVAKSGKKLKFKLHVVPGENGLEYRQDSGAWIWNNTEYLVLKNGMFISE